MKQVSRYHPLLVTLHWALAFLIIAALTLGFFGFAATPNSDPQKIDILRAHMAGGMLILALMAIRFIVRMMTSKPAVATTGFPLLDRIAPFSHYGFYVLVLLMAGTGYTTAILAGLPAIVFGGSGDPLTPTFVIYPTGWRTAILPHSLSASSFCTCLPRSTTNSSEKIDSSGGCSLGGACQIP